MATEQQKGSSNEMDWKNIGGAVQNVPSGGPVVKKRLRKNIREIPDFYFLPRRSLPSAIAIYGSCIIAGIGAGMLVEIWINKKVKGVSFVGYFNSFNLLEFSVNAICF